MTSMQLSDLMKASISIQNSKSTSQDSKSQAQIDYEAINEIIRRKNIEFVGPKTRMQAMTPYNFTQNPPLYTRGDTGLRKIA